MTRISGGMIDDGYVLLSFVLLLVASVGSIGDFHTSKGNEHVMSKTTPPKMGVLSQRLDLEEQPRFFEGGNFTMPVSQRIARLADCALPETNIFTLKVEPWKKRFPLKTIIFSGYVSFREGSWYVVYVWRK